MKVKNLIIIILACALFAILANFVASEYPDGLEWVADKLNFLESGEGKNAINSPMPDYEMTLIGNKHVSGALAAIAGVAITFIAAYLLGKLLIKKK